MPKIKQPKENEVPAFETSLGIKSKYKTFVDKDALETVNKEVAPNIRYQMDAVRVASLYSKKAIRPDEVAALRREMFDIVKRNLPVVEDVIVGRQEWSPTQVRLYSLLTERVIPKMSAVTVEDNSSKRIEDLSLEELEALALGKSKQEAIDAIEVRGEKVDREYSYKERAELRKLAFDDAMDKAEEKYVERKERREEEEAEYAKERFVPNNPGVSYKTNPKRLANLKKSKGDKSVEQLWREKGYTEEQIQELQRRMVEKRAITRAKNRAKDGYNLGMDGDQVRIGEDIQKEKMKNLKDFRVPPQKGVRTATGVQKEIERQKKSEAFHKERAENPRFYGYPETFGIDRGEHTKRNPIKLREIKEKNPELFNQKKEDIRALKKKLKEERDAEKSDVGAVDAEGSGEVSSEDQEG